MGITRKNYFSSYTLEINVNVKNMVLLGNGTETLKIINIEEFTILNANGSL